MCEREALGRKLARRHRVAALKGGAPCGEEPVGTHTPVRAIVEQLETALEPSGRFHVAPGRVPEVDERRGDPDRTLGVAEIEGGRDRSADVRSLALEPCEPLHLAPAQ